MAAEKAISEWFPAKERGFANGLVNAAAATGAIISPPLIAWITLRYGWRFAFVVTGLMGFVWLAVWLILYRLPSEHPRVSPAERDYILGGRTDLSHPRIPYRTLLRMPAVWGLLLSRIFADPVWWFYLFWLPKYLSDVRHFSLAEIGLFAWMPYLAADLGSLFGGWASGQVIVRTGRTPVDSRCRTMIPFALCMPLGIAVNYLPSTPALALICLVTFSHMAWKTNLMTMTNDIFPVSVVGSAAGVVGLGSGLAGAISTPLVGRVVDAFGYQGVFWVMGILHPIAMTIVLVLVGRSSSARNS
jgi:MFS transporter, ACS family, hexuronate transporter